MPYMVMGGNNAPGGYFWDFDDSEGFLDSIEFDDIDARSVGLPNPTFNV
jgi:hypothetical protein